MPVPLIRKKNQFIEEMVGRPHQCRAIKLLNLDLCPMNQAQGLAQVCTIDTHTHTPTHTLTAHISANAPSQCNKVNAEFQKGRAFIFVQFTSVNFTDVHFLSTT